MTKAPRYYQSLGQLQTHEGKQEGNLVYTYTSV